MMQISLSVGQLYNAKPNSFADNSKIQQRAFREKPAYLKPWVPPYARPGSGFVAAKNPTSQMLQFTPRYYAPPTTVNAPKNNVAPRNYAPPHAINAPKNNVALRSYAPPHAVNAPKNNVAPRNYAPPHAVNAPKNNVAPRNYAPPHALNAPKNNVALRNYAPPHAVNAPKNNVAPRNYAPPHAVNAPKNNVALRNYAPPQAVNAPKNNVAPRNYAPPHAVTALTANNAIPHQTRQYLDPSNSFRPASNMPFPAASNYPPVNFDGIPHTPNPPIYGLAPNQSPQVMNAYGNPNYGYSPPPHLRLPVPALEQPHIEDDIDESDNLNENINTNIKGQHFKIVISYEFFQY
jgi:hypothetical protein